jgi:hypothetical protein
LFVLKTDKKCLPNAGEETLKNSKDKENLLKLACPAGLAVSPEN